MVHEKKNVTFIIKNFLRASKWVITCHTCSIISIYCRLGLIPIHSKGFLGWWSRYGMWYLISRHSKSFYNESDLLFLVHHWGRLTSGLRVVSKPKESDHAKEHEKLMSEAVCIFVWGRFGKRCLTFLPFWMARPWWWLASFLFRKPLASVCVVSPGLPWGRRKPPQGEQSSPTHLSVAPPTQRPTK